MPEPRIETRGGSNPPKLSCRIAPGIWRNASTSVPIARPDQACSGNSAVARIGLASGRSGVSATIHGGNNSGSSSAALTEPMSSTARRSLGFMALALVERPRDITSVQQLVSARAEWLAEEILVDANDLGI